MITIWHNPRCSKSRQALALIEATGAEVTIRRYLDDAPTLEELDAVCRILAVSPLKLIRTGEARFRELGLSKDSEDAALMQAMAENPILIERPIAFKDGRARIGRPPETVRDLFE